MKSKQGPKQSYTAGLQTPSPVLSLTPWFPGLGAINILEIHYFDGLACELKAVEQQP